MVSVRFYRFFPSVSVRVFVCIGGSEEEKSLLDIYSARNVFFSSRNDGSLNPARKLMPCQHFLSPLGTRSRRSALCWFYGPGFKPLLLPYCGGVAGLPPFLPPPPSVPPRPPANTFTHSGLSAILPRAAASRSLSFRPVGERRRTGMHFLSVISFCFVFYRRGTRDGENIVGTFY